MSGAQELYRKLLIELASECKIQSDCFECPEKALCDKVCGSKQPVDLLDELEVE